MKQIILILLCISFGKALAQQNISNDHPVKFTLKITEMAKVDSLAVMWFIEPYVADKTAVQVSPFPPTPDKNGLYHQTISFPDSIMGKSILYRYIAAERKSDIWRPFVLDKNQVQEKQESWGFIDGLDAKVKPAKMLFPKPNSPEEIALFTPPFVGITTDGKPTQNLFPIKKTGVSTLPIKNAMTAFIGTLTPEQKTISLFPIESNEWRRWHNIEDWPRAGVCLENMNPTQKELVFNLLKASLSAKGLQKAKDIMTMEAYLATLKPDIPTLGSEKYWFTFYGTPSDTEPYGWQIEGHHLVINYFVLGDQVVMTPTFMGSEPNYIESGEHKGLRTFEVEEKSGLNFYLSLKKKQREKAAFFHIKNYDFNRAEAFRDNEIIPTTGISAKELSKKNQQALLDLIALYVGNIQEGQAKIKMEEVKAHLSETNFTWVQGDNIDGPFYYRIHSPVILIEFDHQTPVFLYDESKPYPGPVKTHIHTVVRTPNGNDYGKDLLKEHLETDHKN